MQTLWSEDHHFGGVFPLCQFPLRQLPASSIPTLSTYHFVNIDQIEIDKVGITKWEVDEVGTDELITMWQMIKYKSKCLHELERWLHTVQVEVIIQSYISCSMQY